MINLIKENLISGKRSLLYCTSLFVVAMLVSLNLQLCDNSKNSAIVVFCVIILSLCLITAIILRINKMAYYKHKALRIIFAVLIALSILASGIAYPIAYSIRSHSSLSSFDGKTATVFGTIVSEPTVSSTGKTIGFRIKPTYISTKELSADKINANIMVYVPTSFDNLKYGDGVRFTAKLSRPAEALGDFQYKKYLLSNNCFLSVYTKYLTTYLPQYTLFQNCMNFCHALRGMVVEYINYVIPEGDEQALLKGILLGAKDDFSDELYNNLSGSGFMHIAAVSGLHVMFLCIFIMFILKRFNIRTRSLITIPILIIFAGVAAFTPSVNRAVIMMIFVLLSNIFLRDPDPMTGLFCAGLILILFNPYIIYSTSFIMSFVSTLSLLLFLPQVTSLVNHMSKKFSKRLTKTASRYNIKISKKTAIKITDITSNTLDSVAVPICCQVGIVPVVAYYFGHISLGTIFGNIIIIPCTMIIFIFGIVGLILYLFVPILAKLVSIIFLRVPLEIICKLSSAMSNSYLNIQVNQKPNTLTFILYYVLMFALLIFLTFVNTKINKSRENNA